MLTNYYKIEQESTVGNFLKEINDKKNSRYIILEDEKSYIEFKEIALNVKDVNEKLKTLKRPLSYCDSNNNKDYLYHLIESGDLVIKTDSGLFDLNDAYSQIKEENFEFLENSIEEIDSRHEVFALNENDKISSAKTLFKEKKTNLLPVIENLKIIGELRPIDLLVNELFKSGNHEKSSYYTEKQDSVLNLPVSNIYNQKPLTICKTDKIKQALELMKDKSLPSVIVTQSNEDKTIYSIFSYKDLFRLIREENQKDLYSLEIVGSKNLYEDEHELIDIYARRTMNKIVKLSDYDNLKITIKTIGNTTGTHLRKMDLKFLLSKGNHILTIEKEVHSSIVDENLNSHQKENWNIPKMAQEALKNLEKMVKNEFQKNK